MRDEPAPLGLSDETDAAREREATLVDLAARVCTANRAALAGRAGLTGRVS